MQQISSSMQIELDAADLIWCCLADEIEAIHYDLTCDSGEDAFLGDAVLYSNNGNDVTVGDFTTMLEDVYEELHDTELVAILNKSRIPGQQRLPMYTGHDDIVLDYPLASRYIM